MTIGSRSRLLGLCVAAVLAGTTLAACDVISLSAEAKDQWTRHYTLNQGGSLEIRNTNGRIDVVAGDGNTVDIVADRVARSMSDDGAREALGRMQITEDVSPDRIALDSHFGGGLEINVSRHIDYTVHVPRWASVRLTSTNGDLHLTGLTGAIHTETTNGRIRGEDLSGPASVETTNGAVSLAFTKIGAGDISCETTNGAIAVQVPKDTSARVVATVANGSIDTRGVDLQTTDRSGRRLEGSMGHGGPLIRLSTTNGAISFHPGQ